MDSFQCLVRRLGDLELASRNRPRSIEEACEPPPQLVLRGRHGPQPGCSAQAVADSIDELPTLRSPRGFSNGARGPSLVHDPAVLPSELLIRDLEVHTRPSSGSDVAIAGDQACGPPVPPRRGSHLVVAAPTLERRLSHMPPGELLGLRPATAVDLMWGGEVVVRSASHDGAAGPYLNGLLGPTTERRMHNRRLVAAVPVAQHQIPSSNIGDRPRRPVRHQHRRVRRKAPRAVEVAATQAEERRPRAEARALALHRGAEHLAHDERRRLGHGRYSA